jgi:hypothetical protein
MSIKEKRTKEGYRLRVYIDALNDARTMTNEEWIGQWANDPEWDAYVPLDTWVAYLEKCIVKESEVFFRKEAA